ncbi:hypothetical protein [uncultured Alsobacter sp.]|uniref:hypothetical protein n=1 Tax=uncultured Alsobacter sp. TaxID=1748258 RepID=UPI0025DCBE26|nr:hypothetical protein [uncultured Alsobacter sp.]
MSRIDGGIPAYLNVPQGVQHIGLALLGPEWVRFLFLIMSGLDPDEATFWLAYRADRTGAWHQGMFELQVCMAMHFADMDEQGKPLPWYVERWTERIFLRHPLLFTDRLLSNVEAQFLEQTFGGTVPLAGL